MTLTAPHTALLVLLCATAGATATTARQRPLPHRALASRIIRFEDADGRVRLGQPTSTAGPPFDEADLVDGAATRRLTGARARVARLLAPVPMPPAIIGIGLNYLAHAHEANLTVPSHPAVFYKGRFAYNHPGAAIHVPRESSWPDYEGELAVVLKSDCKDVAPTDAIEQCVLGYTGANDVSARCWQSDTSVDRYCLDGNATYHPAPIGQWSYSKSFDSHCPLGPALVFPDSPALPSPDASGLQLRTFVNGQLMQNQSTADLIFGVAHLVSFLSTGTTLEAGTVIVTGTPAGVGYARNPPVALQDGDNVTIVIDGIGALTNHVSRPSS